MAGPPHSVGKASPGKLALLYDGACEMCTSGVERACRFDNSGQLEPIDLHAEAARARFPDLQLEPLLEELHAVDDSGNVYRGARAVNEILRRQRGVRSWLALLWYIPGYPWLAQRQYRRIAASRYQRDAAGRLGEATAGEDLKST
jgi:predicted DCC family thiol-disulfide oxidoreductase YuxK